MKNKYTTIQCTKLYSPRFGLSTFCMSTFFGRSMFWYFDVLVWFGLSTFWSVDVLICRRFGLSTLWSVDVLVCRRFGLSPLQFWSVDISVCQCFGLSTFRVVDVLTSYLQKGSTLTHQILIMDLVIILLTTYQNGFCNDIFHNLALLEFYFLNIIYILLYIDFILSVFFQHSNILTRASHHWCLASNIVLVISFKPD